MAISPSHKWGQIIGLVLEELVCDVLLNFALEKRLYLDTEGVRPARSGKRVTWTDKNGNAHDLDFVLERGGTPEDIGTPVAFIESAWRRYTKHSRNKAQEIQGALEPLMATFGGSAPFSGVVLAGEFTSGAVRQLESLGFRVLHFSYSQVVDAFAVVGISASYEESTSDSEFLEKIYAWEQLESTEHDIVGKTLLKSCEREVTDFLNALQLSVERVVMSVQILPLFGSLFECSTIADAIRLIIDYDTNNHSRDFVRYEVRVMYSNGDKIEGDFVCKDGALQFLRMQEP